MINVQPNAKDSIPGEHYTFDVAMMDETAYEEIANIAAGMTHDFRALIRSKITIVDNEHNCDQALVNNKLKNILLLMMQHCQPSRSDFSQKIIRDKLDGASINETLLDLKTSMQSFLNTLAMIHQESVNIIVNDDLPSIIQVDANTQSIIEGFLLNLILNSKQAYAKIIEINTQVQTSNGNPPLK